MNRRTDKHDQDGSGDPRTYFAAERTLLAWVRTGLAMMGFGFVVARFGLFLRELASVEGTPSPSKLGVSLWVGTTLVLLGVVANLFAAVKHWQTVRRLQRGQPIPMSPLSVGLIVALFLALLGMLIAGYLVLGFASES